VPKIRNDVPKARQLWNTVVTARGERLPEARRALRALGRVEKTGFYNVLSMSVDDPQRFVERLDGLLAERPNLADAIASVFAAERCFDFANTAEFEARVRDAALAYAPQLAGKSFHVRVHRRGRKGELVSPDEERAIADALLAATREMGDPARVAFEDPDAIVLVETIGGRAGIALRTRDEYRRHPMLATH
jgi:tRNA(Ser,Leu) C12 N-acetylase TAN1